ncbi:MAG: hypothetical protein H6828_16435 [Planctomycetes bacterium]|nr:hypothetical protein [Planctomycetota bacterium]
MNRLTPAHVAAALTLCAASASAQTVDLAFDPADQLVQVGDAVEVRLLVLASGVASVDFAALDALLDYDPNHLLLLGVDDTLAAEPWFASAFLPDPDGINADLTDGQALYTALCPPGAPATAPPGGAIVTTFQFLALQETPGTVVSLLPALGAFGTTAVYAYDGPNTELTGDLSSTALVRIAPSPQGYCHGDLSLCPCANPGGAGQGCRNSTGQGALLSATGSISVSADDLVLHAANVPPNQFGLFIVGGGTNDVVFGDGLRCVAPGPSGLHRFNPPTHATAGGTLSRGPGLVAASLAFPPAGQIQAGGTYYFQAWFRDPFGGPCGSGFNLTNGLEVTFVP